LNILLQDWNLQYTGNLRNTSHDFHSKTDMMQIEISTEASKNMEMQPVAEMSTSYGKLF